MSHTNALGIFIKHVCVFPFEIMWFSKVSPSDQGVFMHHCYFRQTFLLCVVKKCVKSITSIHCILHERVLRLLTIAGPFLVLNRSFV